MLLTAVHLMGIWTILPQVRGIALPLVSMRLRLFCLGLHLLPILSLLIAGPHQRNLVPSIL